MWLDEIEKDLSMVRDSQTMTKMERMARVLRELGEMVMYLNKFNSELIRLSDDAKELLK